MGVVFAFALACATQAVGQITPPSSGAHPRSVHKPAPKAPAQKTVRKAASLKPAAKRSVLARPTVASKKSVKPAPKASSGVLAFASCYGRFIGWRDELSGLMLQSNSYTPWSWDRARFDRMENAFAVSAKRDRNLVLTLQPTFKEADFPPDVRAAFRAGFKTARDRFAAAGYRHTQVLVLGLPDLSPPQRMAQLEANADQAFAPLVAACERAAP